MTRQRRSSTKGLVALGALTVLFTLVGAARAEEAAPPISDADLRAIVAAGRWIASDGPERVASWYEGTLGFRRVQVLRGPAAAPTLPPQFEAVLVLGDVRLLISNANLHWPLLSHSDFWEAIGPQRIEFSVASLRPLLRQLRRRGVAVERTDGGVGVRFSDPWGAQVEISQRGPTMAIRLEVVHAAPPTAPGR